MLVLARSHSRFFFLFVFRSLSFFFPLVLIQRKWNLPQNKRYLYTKIRVHNIYIFNAVALNMKIKENADTTAREGRKWQIKLQW